MNMTKIELAKFLLEYEELVERSLDGIGGQIGWAQRARVAAARVMLRNAINEAAQVTTQNS
jgi:hypothetical protein